MPLEPLTVCEKLLYSTLRIEYRHPNTSRLGYASAFIFNLAPPGTGKEVLVIVTNKHVIEDVRELGTIRFHESVMVDGVKKPSGRTITANFQDFNARWINHPDASVDLCCTPLGPIAHFMETQGSPPYYVVFDETAIASDTDLAEDHPAAEEVVMYGYPVGICDDKNNFPLMRRGITASHPGLDFNGRSEGALDIACFPGSSGSPVIITREGLWLSKREQQVKFGDSYPILLGILYGGATMKPDGLVDIASIPMQNQLLVDKQMLVLHVGFYIKAKELLRLRHSFAERFPQHAHLLAQDAASRSI